MRFSLVTLVRSKAAWRKHHCPPTVRNIGNSRLDFRASNHHDLSFRNKCHPMCLLLGTRHVVDIYRHLVKVHTHHTPDQWYEYPAQRPWKPRRGISRRLSTWFWLLLFQVYIFPQVRWSSLRPRILATTTPSPSVETHTFPKGVL